MSSAGDPVARIAVVSLHTSPFDQPGTGASGGMNVEIRALAGRLGWRGVAVDIFTWSSGRDEPEIREVGPLARVIQIPEGPIPDLGPYDLVHSHYWLSTEAGIEAARRWDVPLVTSFHTLGEVKNLTLAEGDQPELLSRMAGERLAIRAADRVIAPTEDDARHLIELYDAEPTRIRVVPPGVDTSRFFRHDTAGARRRLALGDGPVALFVGRLQRLKGPDLAVRAFAEAVRAEPAAMKDATLLLVGGPSGPEAGSILPWLHEIVTEEGLAGRVRFIPPVPHEELAAVYSAADVLVMPSRSESFGLAALEAQACGTPVVAAAVGGLKHAVRDGVGGFLVAGREPGDYADRILGILSSRDLAERLGRGAVAHASAFPWGSTVDRLVDIYGELIPELASARAS